MIRCTTKETPHSVYVLCTEQVDARPDLKSRLDLEGCPVPSLLLPGIVLNGCRNGIVDTSDTHVEILVVSKTSKSLSTGISAQDTLVGAESSSTLFR